MKDRIALEMIEAPERDGRLMPSGAVVEYTGGSTGVPLWHDGIAHELERVSTS